MSTQATVLVIGGTGTTCSRVATPLREQATAVRVGTRKPTGDARNRSGSTGTSRPHTAPRWPAWTGPMCSHLSG